MKLPPRSALAAASAFVKRTLELLGQVSRSARTVGAGDLGTARRRAASVLTDSADLCHNSPPGPRARAGLGRRRAVRRTRDGLPPTAAHLQGMGGRDGQRIVANGPGLRSGSGLPPHRWTKVDDPQSEAVIAAHATVIAGGGPAGLTAAYELTRHGHSCVVLEADPKLVGGISRTDQYKGYRFDIGGHRFFSKSDEVNKIWREILGDEFITRSRMSRIYYNRKFFHYPLKPVDALLKLGLLRSVLCILQLPEGPAAADPARAELRGLGRQPLRPAPLRDLLQDLHREGLGDAHERDLRRLGRAADQGALSLFGAIWNAFFGGRRSRKGEVIKTLIDSFQYPRLGPGQMWEAARDKVREQGGGVHLDRRVDPDRARRLGRHRLHRPRLRRATLPLRGRALPLDPADPRADPQHEPAAAGRSDQGRRVAQVPRLSHRRPDRRPGRDVSR